MATLQKLSLASIVLDLDNFRTMHQPDEAAAIFAIIQASESKVRNLAKDIAETGLSLANNIVVVSMEDEQGKYVVMEGNRRISCLKMIENPELVPSSNPQLKNFFQSLAASTNADWRAQNLENINCVVCSEAEALREVERRHATGQDGVGLENWEAMARLRLSRKLGIPVPMLEIVEAFISADSSFNNTVRQALFHAYPITTFERWFIPLASFLGTTPEQLAADYPTHPKKQSIDKLLRHIADGETVTSRTHEKVKDHILPALANVYFPASPPAGSVSSAPPASGGAQPNPVPPPAATAQSGSTSSATAPSNSSQAARGNSPSIRKVNKFNQVVKNFSARGADHQKIQTLIDEIKRLKIADHPHAFVMLLRSIIDISVHSYCNANGIQTQIPAGTRMKDIELNNLCVTVANHMETQDGTLVRKLHGVKNLFSTAASPLSITSMNQTVHGQYVVNPAHVAPDLQSWAPFLIALHCNL